MPENWNLLICSRSARGGSTSSALGWTVTPMAALGGSASKAEGSKVLQKHSVAVCFLVARLVTRELSHAGVV